MNIVFDLRAVWRLHARAHIRTQNIYICVYKVCMQDFLSVHFPPSAPGRRLGAVTFIMCVCARALVRVRMSVCACTWAPFSAAVTFTVCTPFPCRLPARQTVEPRCQRVTERGQTNNPLSLPGLLLALVWCKQRHLAASGPASELVLAAAAAAADGLVLLRRSTSPAAAAAVAFPGSWVFKVS